MKNDGRRKNAGIGVQPTLDESGEAALRAARRQTRVGLVLTALLLAVFASSEVVAFWHWDASLWPFAPLLIAWLSWLYVGLFIVAHDCMHGSLAPSLPGLHRPLGQLCVGLYAAFDFDALRAKHHLHHAAPGTALDPDFAPRAAQSSFGAWYMHFFFSYLSGRQLIVLTALFHASVLLGAPLLNLVLFWLLPALLSSVQLFWFGTYLPHRPTTQPFADQHRARSNAYPVWLSLLTCFHFGYHHEHHREPGRPWWRLPALRRDDIAQREAGRARP